MSKYKLFSNTEEVSLAVKLLGKDISNWCYERYYFDNKPPVLICVLQGAFMFFSDALKHIEPKVETGFISVKSYGNSRKSGEVNIVFEDFPELRGRSVIIFDDILDTGKTLEAITKRFVELGASQIKTAVLLYKKGNESSIKPDWHGLQKSKEDWVLGYGMDDCGLYRNLPEIYKLDKV